MLAAPPGCAPAGHSGNNTDAESTTVNNALGCTITGTDTMSGNLGNDTINVQDGTGGDTANGGLGNDTCTADIGDTTTTSCC